MFSRKAVPEPLRPQSEAFEQQAERLQQAREAVLRCLPVGRVERAPLSVGLEALRVEVLALDAELEQWRTAEVESEWQACRAASAEALAAVPRAESVALSSGELEELLGAVADVVEPLGDAWAAAERRWRGLRRRPPRSRADGPGMR